MVIKMLTAPVPPPWIQTGKYGSMLRWEAVDRPISCSLEIVNQTLLAQLLAHVFPTLKVAAHVPGLSQLLSAAVFHVN